MPRTPHAYEIARGSAPPRKVQRWLGASAWDASKMTTPEGLSVLERAAQRHVHPRRFRRHDLPNVPAAPTAPNERPRGFASLSRVQR